MWGRETNVGFQWLHETARNGISDTVIQPGAYKIEVNGVSKPCIVRSGKTIELAFNVKPLPPEHDRQMSSEVFPTRFAKVVDPRGRPVPFAGIESGGFDEEMTTDSRGLFDLNGFNSGEKIRVKKAPLATRGSLVTSDKLTGPTVVLRLESGVLGQVSGRAVDSAGHPRAAAMVDLVREVKDYGPIISETSTTTTGGRFSFSNLWPGARYLLKVSAPGFKPKKTKWFRLRRGEVRGFGVIRFE
jgi:hypothetical protein